MNREEKKAKNRAYYLKHRRKLQRKMRAYRRKHLKEIKARERANYQRDREKKLAYQRRRRLDHGDEVRAQARARREKHSKRIKAQKRASYLKHVEKNRAKARAKATEMRAALRSIKSMQLASPAAQRKAHGPEPSKYHETESFRIGKRVEDILGRFEALSSELRNLPRRARTDAQKALVLLNGKGYSKNEIEAATRAPSSGLRGARWFITANTGYAYDTVAQYHKEFRAAVARS